MELCRLVIQNQSPIYTQGSSGLNTHLFPKGTVVYFWRKFNSLINDNLVRKGLVSLEICQLDSDIER